MSNAKVKKLWRELKFAFENKNLEVVRDKSEAVLELIEAGYSDPGEFDIEQPGAKREGFIASLHWLYIFTDLEIRERKGIPSTLAEEKILVGRTIGEIKRMLKVARGE